MRKNSKQIPGAKELGRILAKEAKRALPKGKKTIHYPDFSLAIQLFELYNVSSDFLVKDLPATEIVETSRSFLDDLLGKILKDPLVGKRRGLFDRVYDYLSEEDKLEKADLIFAFGSPTLVRAEKAVELYKQDFASIILFSGGGHIYNEEGLPEAIAYKNFAIEKGVPIEAILIEINSITIPDNIRSSLNILGKLGFSLRSLILVNSPYTQRRGWCHFRKYLSDEVRIYRVNCATKDDYLKENWYENEKGIRAVLNEFVKMRVAMVLNTA